MDKVLVCMPYFDGGKQGRELEMSLTGWKKFAKFPFTIAIIGDRNPIIDNFKFVEWVPCKRTEPVNGQYHPHIDMVNKFIKAYELYHDKYEEFIFVCDDYYPVHDFDANFIKKYYYLQSNFVGDLSRPVNTWQHDLAKTSRILRSNKSSTINFTTHFPIMFNFEKLMEMFDSFNMTKCSYVIENLYCNYYKVTPDEQADAIRLGVWRPEDSGEKLDNLLNNPNDKRKFIACSTRGFNETFQNKLCKYLGI